MALRPAIAASIAAPTVPEDRTEPLQPYTAALQHTWWHHIAPALLNRRENMQGCSMNYTAAAHLPALWPTFGPAITKSASGARS